MRPFAACLPGAALSLCAACLPLHASAAEPQHWLPPETVLVLHVPDLGQGLAGFTNLPMARLWRDPVMRAPAEQLAEWWREDLLTPLDRHWLVSLREWTGLVDGQVTFALIATPGSSRDWILAADVGANSDRVTTNLARLRRTWLESGRSSRVETAQGQDIVVLMLPPEPLPADLRSALSSRPAFDESIAPAPVTPRTLPPSAPAAGAGVELCLAQARGLLLLGSSPRALAAVLARLRPNELPGLADQAAFARAVTAPVTRAPLWGWADAPTLLELMGLRSPTNAISAETLASNPEAALFLSPGLNQLARAVGLGGMQSATFSLRDEAGGAFFDLRLTPQVRLPVSLLTALAGPPVELPPPPYVPADALEFDRVRWTSSLLPAALNQAFDDFSPRFASAINFLVETADVAARLKDPDFNVREHLRAGIGEELLRWDRLVGDQGGRQTVRRVLVLPSPAPERLTQALRALFVLFPQGDGDAQEREFLERTIYSVPLPPLPGSTAPTEGLGTLYYAASPGYVVLSTAETLVEEFLRQGETTAKPLKDVPGLLAEQATVVGRGARVAGGWDDVALARTAWEKLRAQPDSGAALVPFLPLPEFLGRALFEDAAVPLGNGLPAFDAVARYFHRSYYALAVGSDGVSFRYYAPRPPGAGR